MGNEDRTTAIERALGMSMGLGILELLEGDLVGASRMLRCNDKDLEPVVGALRTAPPSVTPLVATCKGPSSRTTRMRRIGWPAGIRSSVLNDDNSAN